MSKKVIMTEEKLVDLIYNIVETTLKELDPIKEEVVKKEVAKVKKPAKKVVKITENRLVTLVEKIVKKQIAERKK